MASWFPATVSQLVAEYAALWLFSPWVKEIQSQLQIKASALNMCLAKNPMAMDMINLQKIGDDCLPSLAKNPAEWAVEHALRILSERGHLIINIANNPNSRALAVVEDLLARKILTSSDAAFPGIARGVSRNPLGVDLLRRYPDLVINYDVLSNPAARELIAERKISIKPSHMYLNSADWAVDIVLTSNPANAYAPLSDCLSQNTNARIVAYLREHPELIHWHLFSSNPAAIELLRANPDKVSELIFANPAAIEPTVSGEVLESLNALRF